MTKKVKENAEAEGILNDPKPMVTYDTHKSTIMHRKMQFPFFKSRKNRSKPNFDFKIDPKKSLQKITEKHFKKLRKRKKKFKKKNLRKNSR